MAIKHHELTEDEWLKIRQQIREDFGNSMILLRDKMQRELGFSIRHHREWQKDVVSMYPSQMVHVDFYTEQARTWFLLKYT